MKSLVTRRQAIAATSALVFAPFVARAQEKVGMQLILAADVSGSVNQQRYRTQQDGYLEALGDVRVLNVMPEHSVAEQDKLHGKDLFARKPSECCRMRKVAPLSKALRGYSAWVTGLRRVEAPTRANATSRCRGTSRPRSDIVPASARVSPRRTRMSVVLPAPLGPK